MKAGGQIGHHGLSLKPFVAQERPEAAVRNWSSAFELLQGTPRTTLHTVSNLLAPKHPHNDHTKASVLRQVTMCRPWQASTPRCDGDESMYEGDLFERHARLKLATVTLRCEAAPLIARPHSSRSDRSCRIDGAAATLARSVSSRPGMHHITQCDGQRSLEFGE